MKGYIDGVPSILGNPPIKTGAKVRLKNPYYGPCRTLENNIIRTVTRVRPGTSASGWWVELDGGTPCSCCGLTPGNKLKLDSGWVTEA